MGVRTVAARDEALRRIVAHVKEGLTRRKVVEVKLAPQGSITVADVRRCLNADGVIVKRIADSERYVAASMAAQDGFGINLETTWEADLLAAK